MKIGFVIQDRRIIYGAERATADLASALNEQDGFEIEVILISETRLGSSESPFKQKLLEPGVKVTEIPTVKPFSLQLVGDLQDVAKHNGIDIIHTIGPKATVHSYLAFKGSGLPLVSTLHGWLFRPDPKERLHEFTELFALRRFDRVIVLSHYYEKFLASKKGVAEERIRLIPTGLPGVDNAKGEPRRREQNDPIIFGMMGRLSSEKNHAMLLRAVRQLGETADRVRWVIAGEGPLEQDLKSMAEGLNIEFKGYVTPIEFLREIDVLVLCSRIENLPYSILEGMACSVPTIATRVGGIPDLIDDGQTGMLVPPDDDEALAEAVTRVMNRSDWIMKAGLAAREKLRKEFELESSVKKHIDLYGELM